MLRDLPRYGDLFPTNVSVSDLRYTYYPPTHFLQVAGRTSEAHFSELCKTLGVGFAGYYEGNWPKLDFVDKKYLPTGKLVLAGQGKAYPPGQGRAIIHVYFSPEGEREEQDGSFYIHIAL